MKKTISKGTAQMALNMAGGITDSLWWEGILESSPLLQAGLAGGGCSASHPTAISTLPVCTRPQHLLAGSALLLHLPGGPHPT